MGSKMATPPPGPQRYRDAAVTWRGLSLAHRRLAMQGEPTTDRLARMPAPNMRAQRTVGERSRQDRDRSPTGPVSKRRLDG